MEGPLSPWRGEQAPAGGSVAYMAVAVPISQQKTFEFCEVRGLLGLGKQMKSIDESVKGTWAMWHEGWLRFQCPLPLMSGTFCLVLILPVL